MLVLVPEDIHRESRTMIITTGIREFTKAMMELRMLSKECRDSVSARCTTTETVTITLPHIAAIHYPNRINITSSKRKLPKR